MTLHLIKLCVGAESLEDHRQWVEATCARKRQLGHPVEQLHTTRMVPQRTDALLAGGSLYWVIKGTVQCRQRLLAIRPFKDGEGINRCHLVLEPSLVATRPQPRRPFQGWRYLEAADAPADLGTAGQDDLAAMTPEMRLALLDLGLI